MLSKKYENQVFKEEITILKGSPTFENCVFEKGYNCSARQNLYYIWHIHHNFLRYNHLTPLKHQY